MNARGLATLGLLLFYEEKRHPACKKHNRANHLLAPYAEARAEGGARAEKEIDEKV